MLVRRLWLDSILFWGTIRGKRENEGKRERVRERKRKGKKYEFSCWEARRRTTHLPAVLEEREDRFVMFWNFSTNIVNKVGNSRDIRNAITTTTPRWATSTFSGTLLKLCTKVGVAFRTRSLAVAAWMTTGDVKAMVVSFRLMELDNLAADKMPFILPLPPWNAMTEVGPRSRTTTTTTQRQENVPILIEHEFLEFSQLWRHEQAGFV